MIFSLIINVLTTFVSGLLSLLPTVSLPSASTALSSISDSRVWQYLAWGNYYVPIDLGLSLLALRLAIQLGYYGFEFVMWGLVHAHVLGGGE